MKQSFFPLVGIALCSIVLALAVSSPDLEPTNETNRRVGEVPFLNASGVDSALVSAALAEALEEEKKATIARNERWEKRRRDFSKGDGADALFADAERAEQKQNFKDAALNYSAFCAHYSKDVRVAAAAERAMFNHFRLKEFAEGFLLAEDSLDLVQGTPDFVRLHRVLGNSYLAVPHWGITRGGEYKREQYGQGLVTQSFWLDRKKAVQHLERARLAILDEKTMGAPKRGNEHSKVDAERTLEKKKSAPKETVKSSVEKTSGGFRIRHKELSVDEKTEVFFDLIAALARFTPYDNNWNYWYYAWGASPKDGLEDEGDGTGRGGRGKHRRWGGYWQGELQRARPRGMEVTPDGEVVFDGRPKKYQSKLSATQKMKFLLEEVRRRDSGATLEVYGRSLLLQAALFRSRDGTERLQRLGNWWHNGRYPFKEKAEDKSSLSSLDDDEVLGLVASHIGRYRVPQDESVPALLAKVAKEAPKSRAADEAEWLLGSFYQSRRQYKKAMAVYKTYLQRAGTKSFASSVNGAIRDIETREVLFTEMGVQPAGRRAQVSLQHRNMEEVRIRATQIDVEEILNDFKKSWSKGKTKRYRDPIYLSNMAYRLVGNYRRSGKKRNDFNRFKMPTSRSFTSTLIPAENHQYDKTLVDTPLQKPGLFVLEAQDPQEKDKVLTRGLLLVTGLAVVKKRTSKNWLVWVTDPIKGTPVANADVEIFEYWETYEGNSSTLHNRTRHYKTNSKGIAKVPFGNHSSLTTVRHQGRVGFGDWGFWGSHYSSRVASNQTVSALVTDRPVYRPGDSVQLKTWVRHKKRGRYLPATDVKSIRITIRDAKGAEVFNKAMAADEWGSTSMEFPLDEDAPLGRYQVAVHADGRWTNSENAGFSVEEYKAPEFSVAVKSAGQARLGEKIPVEIRADYLFGGGVAGGKVRYKVFRQDHKHTWSAPQAWDWLYGIGYGRCFYNYAWFPWWTSYGPYYDLWFPWWGPKPETPKELVKEGEGKLDDKGVLHFVIDTLAAKENFADTDHKYVVDVEVTDLSRRVIKGSGNITVTRHAIQLGIEARRGYVSAGEGVSLWLRAQKSDGTGLRLKGRVVVEEVRYLGDNGGTITEEEREVLPVETETMGPVSLTWKAKRTGQYKFTFIAESKDGQEVKSSTLSWVIGPEWNGNKYRMNGLELITDKRSYKPGDVAKVLLNVDQAGSSVLLGTHVENGVLVEYDVLKMVGKSQVVEIKVTEAHVPNFFIEATTVGKGTLFQEARQLYVPPQKSTLNIKVEAKKKEYAPGEEATMLVTTTDAEGKPIAADVALSIFDTAVLYIQEDLTPDIREQFWARLRTHGVSSTSNLTQKFYVYGSLKNPDRIAVYSFRSVTSGFFQSQVGFGYGGVGVKGAGLAGRKAAPLDEDKNQAFKKGPQSSASGKSGSKSKAKKEIQAVGLARRSRKSGRSKDAAAKPLLDSLTSEARPADAPLAEAELSEGMAQNKEQSGSEDSAAKKGSIKVRKNFADTAFFAPSIRTGSDGKAEVKLRFPDNLTTWQIKATGLAAGTRAGQSTTEVRTSKNLLIRLQAPRFFRERDEVVLSGIVHNKHSKSLLVEVDLDVSEHLSLQKGKKSVTVRIPGKSDKRVDWRVKVSGEGEASVRMTVVNKSDADENVDGDAQELRFPVLVHGMTKTVSAVGSIAGDEPGTHEKSVDIFIPKERRPEQTKLTIRVSPTLAGAMLDALPYLLDFPYGCTEQTLSRFVPAVLTRKALQDAGGLELESLKKPHTNLNAQQLTTGGDVDKERLERQHRLLNRSPVFDTKTMDRIIKMGLKRLGQMQNPDGGWGWWGADRSSRYTTAHVVAGLLDAKEADLSLDDNMLSKGQYALEALINQTLYRYSHHDWVGNDDAYAAWVLSRTKRKNDKLNEHIWQRRIKLSAYGKLLAAMTFHNLGDYKKADTLLQNAEQILQDDDENETSWLETRKTGWWYWYNGDIETNAMWLRALNTIRDKKKRAPRVVKWLLNHRQNGWYWRSTRDTAMVVSSLAHHMKASKERQTNYDLEVLLDGDVVKRIHIDQKNLLTFDGEITLQGEELKAGKHKLTFRRTGRGAVYFNTYLEYFTLEEDVKSAGLEIKVERNYYKLVRKDREIIRYGARGQAVTTKEVAYKRILLDTGAKVKSGDLILVELNLESKNDYTFLAFEDPKPAGMEPVALKSGATYGEAVANMELRDEKVVFFLRSLTRGKLKLSYRLRAEIPGEFHAMPTKGFAMYAPELKTNSDELRISVED